MELQLPEHIRKQVKLIMIQARKAALSLSGAYRSSFHGEGLVFSEFRDYIYGDDIRHISWPMTAKWNKTIIKKFEPERQTPVLIAVDGSASLNYGTTEYKKYEIAAQLAAIIGLCAQQNRDPVGLAMFTDNVEKYIPPKSHHVDLVRIIFEVLSFRRSSSKTSIQSACDFLQRNLKKRSIIIFVSDFLDKDYERSLKTLSTRHQVVLLRIEDPSENKSSLPFLMRYQDLETGESRLFSGKKAILERSFDLKRKFPGKLLSIKTDEDYTKLLIHFFRKYK